MLGEYGAVTSTNTDSQKVTTTMNLLV